MSKVATRRQEARAKERLHLAHLASSAEHLVVAREHTYADISSEWDEVISDNPALEPVIRLVRDEEIAAERANREWALNIAEMSYRISLDSYRMSLQDWHNSRMHWVLDTDTAYKRAKAAGERLQKEAGERLGLPY